MKRVVQLVDSVGYVRENCFQHQLARSLERQCDLVQVELRDISPTGLAGEADVFISCLKQRTLMQHALRIGSWLAGRELVVYDQDPWQAYMDDSPFAGAYDVISRAINVKTFALTTEWWTDFLRTKGLPSSFVRMWVLPEYCSPNVPYVERTKVAGFVGSVHPRRRQLLDVIDAAGIQTSVLATNSLDYASFLSELARLRCFVHNESMTYTVEGGRELNFNTGMWVKDIEALSQGCFSIRNVGDGARSYFDGLPEEGGQSMVRLVDRLEDVPEAIRDIERMEPNSRQYLIERTVEYIRRSDRWQETAAALII